MLKLEQVSKRYRGPAGQVHALAEASLEVAAGEFVAIRGPSGSGKTTLLLIAGGLLRPDAGRVSVDGQDFYELSPRARVALRSRAIGFVFQQFHLLPYLGVLENVLVPSLAGGSRASSRPRAEELIVRLGLAGRSGHRPSQLSTGERQRVALARALLNQPKLILADEPTGNLDEESARVVLDELSNFAKAGGAVLLVTHETQAAARASRTVAVRAGRLSDQPAAVG